jgi:hypothetical protein
MQSFLRPIGLLLGTAALLSATAVPALAGDFLGVDLGDPFTQSTTTGAHVDLGALVGGPPASPGLSFTDIERGPNGKLYGVAPLSILGGVSLYEIDAPALTATLLYNYPALSAIDLNLAVDPSGDSVWIKNTLFWEVQLDTGIAFPRGQLPAGGANPVWGLAFDNAGNLFTTRQPNGPGDADLWLVNQTDAGLSINLGGISGIDSTTYQWGLSLASDAGSGAIHVYSYGQTELYSLQTTVPSATLLTDLPGIPVAPNHVAIDFADNTCTSGSIVTYGSGCPGSGGFVTNLAWSGCAQAGVSASIEVGNALGGSPVFLLFSGAAAMIPFGSCDILVDLNFALVSSSLTGSGAGNGSLSLPVTAPAASAGKTAYIQAWVLDLGLGFTTVSSNGLEVTFGP